MKNLRLLSALLVAGVSATANLSAAPLFAIGDNIDIYFNGSASLRYQDNLFLTPANEQGDWQFIFSPGVEILLGRQNSAGQAKLFFREDFNMFVDYDDLNDELPNVFFNAKYDTGVASIKIDAAWYVTNQLTANLRLPGAGDLIQREIGDVKTYGEYEISEKTSVGAGFDFYSEYFQNYRYHGTLNPFGFQDYLMYSVPVDVYWKFSRKLDFSAGYRFRDVDVGASPDYQDNFFNVGMRGELSPKIQGQARIGYQQRDFDRGGNDQDSLSLMGNFSYTPDVKTRFDLGLLRDFATGGVGESLENTGFTFGASYAISPMLTASANLGYTTSDYQNSPREDDTYDFGVGLRYSPNEFVSLSAGYVYQRNDSSISGLDYRNNIINLTASLRY